MTMPDHQPTSNTPLTNQLQPQAVPALNSVKRAIRYLVSVDADQATVRNGRGFTGFDSKPGHKLLRLANRWTLADAEKATRITGRYVGQLLRVGIALPHPSLVAAEAADPQLLALSNAISSGRVWFDCDERGRAVIAVETSYHADLVPRYRGVAGGFFNRAARRWEYLYSLVCYRAIVAAFPDFDLTAIVVDEEATNQPTATVDVEDDDASHEVDDHEGDDEAGNDPAAIDFDEDNSDLAYEDYDGGRYDY